MNTILIYHKTAVRYDFSNWFVLLAHSGETSCLQLCIYSKNKTFMKVDSLTEKHFAIVPYDSFLNAMQHVMI